MKPLSQNGVNQPTSCNFTGPRRPVPGMSIVTLQSLKTCPILYFSSLLFFCFFCLFVVCFFRGPRGRPSQHGGEEGAKQNNKRHKKTKKKHNNGNGQNKTQKKKGKPNCGHLGPRCEHGGPAGPVASAAAACNPFQACIYVNM